MGRPRKKPEPDPAPKRARPSTCPRAFTHRVGVYCKTCDTLIR